MNKSKNFRGDILDIYLDALEHPGKLLPAKDQIVLDRLKSGYTHWLEHPAMTDAMMRDFLIANHQVGRMQAYRDISLIKAIFGNVPKADKEFQRARANHLLELAAAAAIAGNDKKANSLTKIAAQVVKANQLDVQEGEEMPWDTIMPRDESFTVDPAVIGIDKVPNIEEKARKLLKSYVQEIDGPDRIPEADEQ